MASPAFAVSAVAVVVSPEASVVAARAFGSTSGVPAVACVERLVASGHQRVAVVIFAVLVDASARRVVFPALVAAGADRALADASVEVADSQFQADSNHAPMGTGHCWSADSVLV